MIDTEFEKVRLLPGNTFSEKRTKALEKVEKRVEDASRIISPVDYNPHLPNISQIFRKHHKAMLLNGPHLQEVFKNPPMASYRQPPNLRRLMWKAKLYPLNRHNKLQRGAHKNAPGWKKCGKNCKICSYTLDKTNVVTGLASGYSNPIKEAVTCDSEKCHLLLEVYKTQLWRLPKLWICGKQKEHLRTDWQSIETTQNEMWWQSPLVGRNGTKCVHYINIL